MELFRHWFSVFAWLSIGFATLPAQQTPVPIQPADDAPQPMSPTDSAAAIRLPEGFVLDLLASEPVVTEPSCIAWDEWGRLFVCELHGYNIEGHIDVSELNKTGQLDKEVRRIRWELQGGEIAERAATLQYGVLKMLRDTDGDGVMDESIVWAEDLPPCYGILAARGGIIVTCAPDIVFIADRDGDGFPDVRRTLLTGFEKRVMERGINNPRWGADHWIYVGGGGEGGTITGPNLSTPVTLGNTDFRVKPDGSAIEPVNGRVGTFGMTINDVGDRFPASGGQPATYALPLPYRYLKRNPWVDSPPTNHSAVNYNRGYRISAPHPWRVRRGQDPAWVKFYGARETNSNYFSGGCSNEYYGDPLFPPEYHGNLFYCEPSLNIVHRCIIERDGAGYRGFRAAGEKEAEFLASTDQWFRPMNLRVGPDGALYIVDMYREIIEDYSAIPRYLQQQYGLHRGGGHGRIWRLRPSDKSSLPAPNSFNLAKLNDSELSSRVGSPYRWIRQTASRLLAERQASAAAPRLSELISSDVVANTCIAAMYTLREMNSLEPQMVIDALQHPHPSVRLHALRLCEAWLANDPGWLDELVELASDPDPSVRLQAAMTLGESAHPDAAHLLVQLAVGHGGEPWMSTAIASSSRQHAEAILDGLLSIKETRTPLIAPLAKTLSSQRDGSAMGRIMSRLLPCEASIQVECLQGFLEGISRGVGAAPESDDGYAALPRLMANPSEDVRELATRLAASLPLADEQQLESIFAGAAATAADSDATLISRVRAISVLASAPSEMLANQVSPLLRPTQPLEIQQAAIEALNASPDPGLDAVLTRNWSSFTPTIRTSVIGVMLARTARQASLLDAIARGEISAGELSGLQREQLLRSSDADVARRATRLLTVITDQELQERFELYRTALRQAPDPEQGAVLYRKHCMQCHPVGADDPQVGPHLGSVVNRPNETLLMDLLDPSGRIEPEFRSYIVLTNDGRSFAGVLVSETATGVLLRKEKGVEESVLRTDIEALKVSEVSLMPDNLHEQLTPTDVANLIAHLRQTFLHP